MQGSEQITQEEAGWQGELAPRRGSVGQQQKAQQRMRRVMNSEQYLALFENSYAHSSFRRGLFRFFCGLVAYVQFGGALVLLSFSLSSDWCRRYVAVVPLVTLAIEALLGAVLCMIVGSRLAFKAEIFQVWRQVLTTNLTAVLASTLALVVVAALYRDAQEDTITAWETVPTIFVLAFHLTLQVLIKDENASSNLVQIAVTLTVLLAILFYVLHSTTGAPVVSAFFPIPLCLFFLIGLGFRDISLAFLRQEYNTFGIAREATAVLAYGVLLLPALELCIVCAKAGNTVCGGDQIRALSWASASITLPLGVGLLAPTWIYNMGGWAENLAFGFLSLSA